MKKHSNSTETTVGIEAINHLLSPPKGAWAYIKRFLISKDINPSQAAKVLDVNASTVKRLLDGGRLTTSMASKFYHHFDIDPDILFNLEAKASAYEARQLAQRNAA